MRYFTADLHLAHPKLADLRGFDSVGAHDAAVMAELYRLDSAEDELWILGDVPEDEATGSAAVRLTGHLRRNLTITQGKGSQILTTWYPEGRVSV